ncbi:hypothetical protein ACS0TY_034377 [Phlomoides rotata]
MRFLEAEFGRGSLPDGSVGLGFVITNSAGAVVLAGAKRCRADGGSNTIIEALDMCFGAAKALEEGLHIPTLEADSRNLVMALKGEWEFSFLGDERNDKSCEKHDRLPVEGFLGA